MVKRKTEYLTERIALCLLSVMIVGLNGMNGMYKTSTTLYAWHRHDASRSQSCFGPFLIILQLSPLSALVKPLTLPQRLCTLPTPNSIFLLTVSISFENVDHVLSGYGKESGL